MIWKELLGQEAAPGLRSAARRGRRGRGFRRATGRARGPADSHLPGRPSSSLPPHPLPLSLSPPSLLPPSFPPPSPLPSFLHSHPPPHFLHSSGDSAPSWLPSHSARQPPSPLELSWAPVQRLNCLSVCLLRSLRRTPRGQRLVCSTNATQQSSPGPGREKPLQQCLLSE